MCVLRIWITNIFEAHHWLLTIYYNLYFSVNCDIVIIVIKHRSMQVMVIKFCFFPRFVTVKNKINGHVFYVILSLWIKKSNENDESLSSSFKRAKELAKENWIGLLMWDKSTRNPVLDSRLDVYVSAFIQIYVLCGSVC